MYRIQSQPRRAHKAQIIYTKSPNWQDMLTLGPTHFFFWHHLWIYICTYLFTKAVTKQLPTSSAVVPCSQAGAVDGAQLVTFGASVTAKTAEVAKPPVTGVTDTAQKWGHQNYWILPSSSLPCIKLTFPKGPLKSFSNKAFFLVSMSSCR